MAGNNKMQNNRNIQITDLPEIDEIDKARALYSLALCYDKIQRIVSNELHMHVHFKQQRKAGIRKQHAVNLKVSYPGKTLVSKASGWQLLTVLQTAIKTIDRETVNAIKRA